MLALSLHLDLRNVTESRSDLHLVGWNTNRAFHLYEHGPVRCFGSRGAAAADGSDTRDASF